MNRNSGSLLLTVLLVGIIALAGCSSKYKLVPGAPDWVNEGSGAFEVENTMLFYGVGAVSGIASQTLARQTADQRARADIGRQISTFINEIYRDYQTATTTSSSRQSHLEQHIDDTLETLTKVTVRGAKIIDHWRDPETNTIFALARLDLEGVTTTLDQDEQMNPKLRKYITENAEKTFDRLKNQ